MSTHPAPGTIHPAVAALQAHTQPNPWLMQHLDLLRTEALAIRPWPAWCWMRSDLVTVVAAEFFGQTIQAALRGAEWHALHIWRMGKIIVRFDETLYQELTQVELKGDLPAEVFERLPFHCLYIETPNLKFYEADSQVLGAFVTLDYEHQNRKSIRIMAVLNGGENWLCRIPLVGTIDEGLEAATAEARQASTDPDDQALLDSAQPKAASKMISAILSLALYTCIPNADYEPPPPLSQKKGRTFARDKTHVLKTGFRWGAALRTARQRWTTDREQGNPSGMTVNPHFRQTHWHGFRTGTDRQGWVVYLLPPIPVNFNEEELDPILRPVRRQR